MGRQFRREFRNSRVPVRCYTRAVFASLALFGILGLPILTGTALRVLARLSELRPGIAPFTSAFAAIGALLVLTSAWGWWALNPEIGDAVVGGWMSVSFTGTPLAVGFGAAACSVILALAAARSAQLLDPDATARIEVVSSHGLLMLGAALAVLGSTTPTLLIGTGMMQFAGVWHAARRVNSQTAIRIFSIQLLGLMLAALVLTMQNTVSGDYRLNTTTAQTAGLFTTLMSAAIVLQANLLPFGASQHATSHPQMTAGLLGAIALVARTATVTEWVSPLAAVTCAFWAMHALSAADARSREAHIREAAAAFTLAFGMHAPHMAACGWLLGSAMLEQAGFARILAGLSLLAVPGTPGFPGLTAAPDPGTGLLGPATMVLQAGCRMILTFALLRHTFGGVTSTAIRSALSESITPRRLPALLLAAAHMFVLGAAPQWFGGISLSDALTRAGAAGWASLVVGIALGAVLWRISGSELDDALRRAGALLLRTELLFRPLYAALARLQRSFGALSTLLDSEGALLLTCLALVLAVLILGQSAP